MVGCLIGNVLGLLAERWVARSDERSRLNRRPGSLVTLCLGAAAAFALLLGCGDGPRGLTPRVRQFLGERTVAAIQGATRVEAFRVDPQRRPAGSDPAGPAIGGYPITATVGEQGQEFASALADVLLEDRTYQFEIAKGCIFSPGVGFRLWKQHQAVAVLLCFHCDELEVLWEDPAGAAQRPEHEDFDAACPALVQLAKLAFPDDPEIQALRENQRH